MPPRGLFARGLIKGLVGSLALLAGCGLIAQTTNCVVGPSGMVTWFQGESNAGDFFGANSGVLQNGVTFAPGKVGTAFNFDGVDDYVSSPTARLTWIQDTFTIEFWVYPTASRASTTEANSGITGTSAQRYAIAPENSGDASAGAGISVGTNGISVFEHAANYLPSLLVYDAPITNWTHVAVVYQNKQPSLYVNGVLVRTGLTSVRSYVYPSKTLGDTGNYGHFKGLLDEVSIYGRALSATEIQAIYNADSAGKCPPPCAVAPLGLISWWGGQLTAADSQNNFPGTLQNGATYGVGKVGAGFSLDGVNDYIQAPASSFWAFGTNQFTIDLWANFAAATGSRALVACDAGGGGNNKWIFWLNSGVLQFHINGVNGNTLIGSAPFSPVLGQWYHLAVTRAGSSYIFYINGSAVSTNSDSTAIPNPGVALTIGQAENSFYFQGLLDEVDVFNRALSGAEILAIYNADSIGKCVAQCIAPPPNLVSWWPGDGNAYDVVGLNLGYLSNGVTYALGKDSQAFNFTTSNGFVRVPDSVSLNFTNEFAISLWFKTPALTNSQILLSKGLTDANEEFTVNLLPDGSIYWDYGDLISYVATSPGIVAAGQWNHLVVMFSPSFNPGGRVYLNGVQAGIATAGNGGVGHSHVVASGGDLYIGSQNAGSPYYAGRSSYSGLIDEVDLYSRALTDSEVQALYTAGSAGKCKSAYDLPFGSTLWIQGNGSVGSVNYTTPGFLNAGTIRMESINGGYNSDLTISSGMLTNAPAGVVNANLGSAGGRTIFGDVLNLGTVNANTTMTLGKSGGVFNNAGAFNVPLGGGLRNNGQALTFNQNGGTLGGAGSMDFTSIILNFNGGTIAGNIYMEACTLNLGAAATGPASFTMTRSSSTINGDLKSGQTIWIQGSGRGDHTTITAANGFRNDGTLRLESINGGYNSNLGVTSGTLTNGPGGVINVNVGAAGPRYLFANLLNLGTINANLSLTLSKASGVFENQSNFTIASGQVLYVNGQNQTFNQNAGTLSGAMDLTSMTFNYNGGTIIGTPYMEACVLNLNPAATSPASFTMTRSSSTFNGDVKAGQTLWIQGSGRGDHTTITAANGFRNDGTLRLESINGGYNSNLGVTSGTLTNGPGGVINVNVGAAGPRYLFANLLNLGTFNANLSLTLSKASGVFENQSNFTIAPGQTVYIGGQNQTFNQNAGTLSGAMDLTSMTFNYNGGTIIGTPYMEACVLNLGPTATGPASFTMTRSSSTFNGDVKAGQTLWIQGSGRGDHTTITAANGFRNDGTLRLESINGGYNSNLGVTSGTLTNGPGGVINVNVGAAGPRYLFANLLNLGTFNANLSLTLSKAGGVFENQSNFTIASGQALYVSGQTFNQMAGTLSGSLIMSGITFNHNGGLMTGGSDFTSSTFNFNGGTIVGGSYMEGCILNLGPASAGPASFTMTRSSSTINGDVKNGTTIWIQGSSRGDHTTITAAHGFRNDGTLRLESINAGYNSNLGVTSGTLTNGPGGVINVNVGAGGPRYLFSSLLNLGTFNANLSLTLSKASGVFENQNNFTIAAGQTVYIAGQGQVFNQTAGTLSGALDLTSITFNYNGGTITGTPYMEGCVLNLAPAATSPASFTMTRSSSTFNGDIKAGQSIWIQGSSRGDHTTMTVAHGFRNDGTLRLESINAGYNSNLGLTTGTLTNGASGIFNINGGAGGPRIVTADFLNQGTVNVNYSANFNKGAGVFVNEGTLNIASAQTLTLAGTYAQNSGVTRLTAAALAPSGTVNILGGVLTGTGTIVANLSNSGRVAPGITLGSLAVSGNFTQNAAGALEVAIGGTTAGTLYDRLTVSGSAQIDGRLVVTLANGFSPTNGNSFAILTSGGLTGKFKSFELPSLGTNRTWSVEYSAGQVVLKVVGQTLTNSTSLISGTILDSQSNAVQGLTVYAYLDSSNLVQNSSFELPSNGGSQYLTYGVGSTSIPGWTVTGSGNIAIHGTFLGAASDGIQYFDPTGTTGGGGISQIVPTVPGRNYELSFYHGTYSVHGYVNAIGVSIGSSNYVFGEAADTGSALRWTRERIPFVATDTNTIIGFRDVTGANSDDNFVDAVQILPPGSGFLLETTTDANGFYQINVSQGSWVVGVNGLPGRGYNDVTNQIALITTEGTNAVVNFTAVPFSEQYFTVNPQAAPAAAGTLAGGGTYPAGANVTVIATPVTNTLPYLFVSWTENGLLQSSSPSYSFLLTRDRQLVANFTLPTFQLSASNAPSFAGTIGGAGTFTYGTTNVLTAYPAAGYRFVNWTDGGTVVGTAPGLPVVVTSNRLLVANYVEANPSHDVTTAIQPVGLGAVSGAGSYLNGQTGVFSAPIAVTNSTTIYTFRRYTLNGGFFSSTNNFNKVFSTLDPTNMLFVAEYDSRVILPQLISAVGNYNNPVPATTNFILTLQFDRGMSTNPAPLIVLTNPAASVQPSVPAGGAWSMTVFSNDTFTTPAITFTNGMDGTNQVFISLVQDTVGAQLAPTNALNIVVDAIAPPAPVLSLVASNSTSATLSWQGYAAPADLSGFRVYLQSNSFNSVNGLAALTRIDSNSRSFQFGGLALDRPYYAAVASVDVAGNMLPGVTPFTLILPSTVPPPVTVLVTAVGASSARVSWTGYNTASLFGFAGFRVYLQETNFSSVAGLVPLATLPPEARTSQIDGLDRTRSYFIAVVGFNGLNGLNASVVPGTWTDPYAGLITSDLTMGGPGQQTVDISQNVIVTNNATLTILPGTTVRFAPGVGLRVSQGRLLANGTPLDPIVLTSTRDGTNQTAAAGDWNGIILGPGSGNSLLRHLWVKYAAGFTLDGSSPTVDAFTALNNLAGLTLKNNATLTTRDALLAFNGIGAQQNDTSSLNLHDSVIKNNGTNALNLGAGSLVATQNWWGTAVAADIQSALRGNVASSGSLGFEPILTPAVGTLSGASTTGSRSLDLKFACRTAESLRASEDSLFNGVFFIPFSSTQTFQLSEGGGQKTIYVQYRSLTGQTNSPLALTVNYITDGPIISSFNLSEGQVLGRPLTVTGAASAVLGMSNLEFYVDNVLQQSIAGASYSQRWDVRNFTNSVHRVKFLARDNSGNIATAERNVVVALTPPLAPIISTPSGTVTVNSNAVVVSGTAEPLSDLRMTRNGLIVGTLTADAAGNFSMPGVPLIEGQNQIVVVASDVVGSSSSAARQVFLDSGPPAKLILNPPSYQSGLGLGLTWQFAATGERATHFQLFWHTAAFTSTNQATGHSVVLDANRYTLAGIANGTYYFSVVGYDDVGNASPLSDLVSVNYDAVAPALTATFDRVPPLGPGPVVVTLTASEALAAVPTLTITPLGGNHPTLVALTNAGFNTYRGVYSLTTNTPSGVAVLNAVAQDLAGNSFVGAPNGPVLEIDVIAPSGLVSTAPSAPIQTLNPTNVTVSLTLSEPQKTGTTPVLSFAPPSGAPVTVTLSGNGTNWSGALALDNSMGTGLGQFSLVAQDNVGNIGSNILAGTTLEIYSAALPPPPAAVTGLQAQSLTGGQILLTWTAVTNAESYRLYREPGTNAAIPTALVADNLALAAITNLPPADGSYRYAVTATRRGSESGVTNFVVALSDRTPPPAPTNVLAQLLATGVQVGWQQPAGESPDHFNIYRNGTLIRTTTSPAPIVDAPPRGTANYVVAAADAFGNESSTAASPLQLLVGAVNNLQVLITLGHAPILTWTSDDFTAVGFNIYRNNLKQNPALVTTNTFTDSLPIGSELTQYTVRAVNAGGDEGAPRSVNVYPVDLALRANSPDGTRDNPLVIGYFDQFKLSVSNLAGATALPLRDVELRRVVQGFDNVLLSRHAGTNLAPGGSFAQAFTMPALPAVSAPVMRLRAIQETDLGGSSVIYEQFYLYFSATPAGNPVEVVASQLPLAGGLSEFEVRVFNRGFTPIDLIVTRNRGHDPGDLYISVKNAAGQEVSRGEYNDLPSGTRFLPDGRGYVTIAPGDFLAGTVSGVLVPDALSTNATVKFEAVVSKIYYQLGTSDQVENGPLVGSINSALAQTDYYGTALTDHAAYANDTPVIISGQAISRQNHLPVPNTILKIGFTTRGFRWYRTVLTDTNGNYSFTYLASPGLSGRLTVWAAHPDVFDALNQAQVSLFRVYASPSSGDVRMSKNGSSRFSIGINNPGDESLGAFTTSFRAYTLSGTNQINETRITGSADLATNSVLAAGETRSVAIQLNATLDAPDRAIAEFTFTSALGATFTLTANLTLLQATPVLTVLDPPVGYIEVSLDRGGFVSRSFTVVNRGLDTMKGVELIAPTNLLWVSPTIPPASNGRILLPDIPIGTTNTFTVVFAPPVNAPLGPASDFLILRGTNSGDFRINVFPLITSDQKGAVQFYVDDILGLAVTNGTIRLRNAQLQTELAPVQTDTNGYATISGLQEGTWGWQISAPGHSADSGIIEIIPGQTVQAADRLSRSLVTISFRVDPVPFTDRYEIKIEQTFETHVPAPVIVLSPPYQEFEVTPPFETTFTATAKNEGLLEAFDVTIDGQYLHNVKLVPLITYIPKLRPFEEIEIPFRVIYDPDAGAGPMVQSRQEDLIAGKAGSFAGDKAGGYIGGLVTSGLNSGFGTGLGLSNIPIVGDKIGDYLGGKVGDFVGDKVNNAVSNLVDKLEPECLKVDVPTLDELLEMAVANLKGHYFCNAPDGKPVLANQLLYVAVKQIIKRPQAKSLWQKVTLVLQAMNCIPRLTGNGSPGRGPECLDCGYRGGGEIGTGGGYPPRSEIIIEGRGGSGNGCFVAGTLVLLADGRSVPIESITTNNVVRTGTHAWENSPVMKIDALIAIDVQKLEFAPDRGDRAVTLYATLEHQFWVDGKGWRAVRDLRVGDWVVTAQQTRCRLTALTASGQPTVVYNLQNWNSHAFYANGILVHDGCGLAPVEAFTRTSGGKP